MDHKELDVWKYSIDFVMDIYKITSSFPKEEVYGLTSQIKRSAVSVPSNIAEGLARQTKKEQIQFLYIALGSLSELETQLIISKKLGFLQETAYNDIQFKIERIRKLLTGLIKYQKRSLKGVNGEK